MLTHIHIKNFVIVKSLSLDFHSGLHVLTGETGAGKSIWIDAIEIGLGGRADTQLIYPGEKTGDITLCFDLKNLPDAKNWLTSQALPDDDECIIRRIIDQDKPSRTTLNGVPIPQQMIRIFSDYVLSIHGQHQHQRLLKSEAQRDLLDHYADNTALLSNIRLYFDEWKSIDVKIETLAQQIKNKSSDLALWQYQLDELQKLMPQENEYESLFSRYQQLHHQKQFAVALNETLALIHHDNTPAACDLAQQAWQQLQRIHTTDPAIENSKTLLETAVIHLTEARDTLTRYCHHADFSADELMQIEQRLALLQDIARKHHVDPNQLSEVMNQLKNNILQLEKADEIIATFTQQKNTLVLAYQEQATTLTHRREKAAKKLSTAITNAMQSLGMTGGKFDIQLHKNAVEIHPYGNEQIHFAIATNPGQTPHALSQIVSGGELSRLSLILQVLTAEQNNTPTFIFDEVDVGIGGKTADLVGRLLRELSEKTQVLCVTHLPQVAACGHHHFKAAKITDGKTTATVITPLTEKKRTEEIARMLSGSTITEKSLAHANELLTSISV